MKKIRVPKKDDVLDVLGHKVARSGFFGQASKAGRLVLSAPNISTNYRFAKLNGLCSNMDRKVATRLFSKIASSICPSSRKKPELPRSRTATGITRSIDKALGRSSICLGLSSLSNG